MIKYYNYPIRKDFELNLQFDGGVAVIKYKQATIKETLDFSLLDKNEMIKWVEKFIDNINYKFYIEKKWWQTEKRYMLIREIKKRKLKKDITLELRKYINILIETKFRKHKSLFKNIKDNKDGRKSIYNLDIMLICKKYNIHGPETLFNNYTVEQLDWMMDGIIFENNELTEEGKLINNEIYRENFVDKEKEKEKLKKTKDFFKELEKRGAEDLS